MAQANEGAAGGKRTSGSATQADQAAVADRRSGTEPTGRERSSASYSRWMDDARVPVAALVAAGAPVAGALLPQALVPARVYVDAILLGPLPTKSNESCKILPKIVDETYP